MGLFDEAMNASSGLQAAGLDRWARQPGLLRAVAGFLSRGQPGGLSGLVQSFQQKGLGEAVSSWVGRGPNKPISAQQVREGLGEDNVRWIAGDAGVSEQEAGEELS